MISRREVFMKKTNKKTSTISQKSLNKFQKIIPMLAEKDLHDKKDCNHQKILNVCYYYWQTNNGWSYEDMLNNAENLYGPIAKMAVMLGKYNQQVCNGGHSQYHFNGYSHTGDDEEKDLHDELVELIKKYLDINKKTKQELLSIMESVEVEQNEEDCYDCGGSGQIEEEDGWGDDEDDDGLGYGEECTTCDGDGFIKCGEYNMGPDYLDYQYYKINEKVMSQTSKFFTKLLKKQAIKCS